MVYRFKLVSDEVSNFSREIEIDSESSFLQLRDSVLDSVNFSKEEFDSFFLCDDDWQRGEEITIEDMGNSSSDQDLWIMEDTPISQLVEEVGQKLIFVFDYMADRCFYMELKEIIPGRHLSTPFCTLKKGNAPAQIVDIDDYEKKIDVKINDKVDEEIDIDMIAGEADFNEEDFEDGFDII